MILKDRSRNAQGSLKDRSRIAQGSLKDLWKNHYEICKSARRAFKL